MMSVSAHIRSMLIHEAVAFEELGRKLAKEDRQSYRDQQILQGLDEVVRAMRMLAPKLKTDK